MTIQYRLTRLPRLHTPAESGFLVLTALLIWAATLCVTGSISGLVTDSSGVVIVGAEVLALNVETGIRQTAKTDSAGFYSFPTPAIGRYEIAIRQSGFKEYRAKDILINVNTALRVDAALQIGAVTQEVSVTGAAAHVETTNTQMGEVIAGSQMVSLPLNGRSYTDLLALQPGVTPISAGEYSGAVQPSGGLERLRKNSVAAWFGTGVENGDCVHSS